MTQRRSRQSGSTASSHSHSHSRNNSVSHSNSHSHAHAHTFSAVTTTTTKHSHATSSAFSASANPDEDWTKIPDLAERRRIQNRIAQRNYRKKLKKKLEDLEARAASAPPSPPELHKELDRAGGGGKTVEAGINHMYARPYGSPEPAPRYISPGLLSPGLIKDECADDDNNSHLLFDLYSTAPSSVSPQPLSSSSSSSYWPYAVQDPTAYPVSCEAAAGYAALSATAMPTTQAGPYHSHAPYLPPMTPAVAVPVKPGSLPADQPGIYAPSDLLRPYGMNETIMALDMHIAHMEPDSNHQTPLLSDSFDVSLAGSPTNSSGTFPMTPLLFPSSPLHL